MSEDQFMAMATGAAIGSWQAVALIAAIGVVVLARFIADENWKDWK